MTIIRAFTDGGSFVKYNVTISVGVVSINKNDIITFEKINFNRDSDYVEMFAIKKTLSRIYGHLVQRDFYNGAYRVEFYTDSKISIKSIMANKLISKPSNSGRDRILYEIYDLLNRMKGAVTFYHINSHIPSTKFKKYCRGLKLWYALASEIWYK